MVQVYHRDCACRKTRPARELVAFAKLSLQPGEQRELTIEIPAEQLGWLDSDGSFQQDPGKHKLWLATGADPRGGELLELTVVA